MGDGKQSKKIGAYVAGFFLMGTSTVIFVKAMMQTKVHGDYFKVPLYYNLLMFIGMVTCLFPVIFSDGKLTRSLFLRISYPGFLNFLCTYLMIVGQMWTLLSVWQMVRGSVVVFTALIRRFWLKRRVFRYEWLGIGLVCFALVIVGGAGIGSMAFEPGSLEGEATLLQRILGIVLILIAEAIQALQTVVEEVLMEKGASVIAVVGGEGFWGLIFNVIAMIIANFVQEKGFHEDSIDTFKVVGSTPLLAILSLCFCVTVAVFNVMGVSITKIAHSITRNIMEATRPLFIWVVGLILRYTVGREYGEPWTPYSYLELFGFAILVYGLFVYNKLVKLPFVKYDENAAKPLLESV